MKWVVAALLICVLPQARAQDQAESSPPLKLEGIVIAPESGGYLIVSVPKRDIMRFLKMAGMLSHVSVALKVLERLDEEAHKIAPTPSERDVPFGACFLASSEVFPHHKVIDRFVQPAGAYTYTNVRGLPVTVRSYIGGPTSQRQSSGG